MKLLDEAGLTQLVKDLKRDVGDRVKATYDDEEKELTFTALNGDYLTVPVNQFDIDLVYPVGSIYISTSSESPATLFGKGTWEIVGNGRVLWGVGATDTAGNNLEAQLPNIKGQINFTSGSQGHTEFTASGAFQRQGNGSYTWPQPSGTSTSGRIVDFNAARTNQIYTDNGIVRPNAFTVKFWRRTA